MERLQKIISAHGIVSRRKAEELIEAGLVLVNGVAAKLGDSADDTADEIIVDGIKLGERPQKIYIMLHKPRGYVTTLSDEQGRKDVAGLVADCGGRVFPVGRLDLNSEGLLIMTNDGEFADKLMHPKHEIPKSYLVWVRGDIDKSVAILTKPMILDGFKVKAAEVEITKRDQAGGVLKITIHEGKNRQIRRMCIAAGLYVSRLLRISEGNVELGSLMRGKWRHLTENEISGLINY